MEKIKIFDTTLRDGDQAPGAAMSIDEKKQIAIQLDTMGVDIIEAGFAASSELDFRSIFEICKATNRATICSLSRSLPDDVKASALALTPAIEQGRGRIHIFVSTSPMHMTNKLHKTPDEVVEMTRQSVSYARKFTPDVEWSAEDATRSDIDFLVRCIQAAVNAGATTINLPDTVGCMASSQYYRFIKTVIEKAAVGPEITFSVHCHNDKGLATANTLMGIEAGARQAECSVNGLGERAGNAALEEVIMNILSAPDVYPFVINFDTHQMLKISKMVEEYSGFAISNNKPVVGKTAFVHGSGIHQDGMVKALKTGVPCIYGGFNPTDYGIEEQIVLTRHSGRNGVRYALEKQGISADEQTVLNAFQMVKTVGEQQKIVPFDMLKTVLEMS